MERFAVILRWFTIFLVIFGAVRQTPASLVEAAAQQHDTTTATTTITSEHNTTDPNTCSSTSASVSRNSDDSCYVSILDQVPTVALHKYVIWNLN